MTLSDESPPVAAVDLGSNSFHMVIGRVLGPEVTVLDRIRDPVRLASGLDGDGCLSDEALERALDSLRRFRQRLGDLPPSRVRAIGTAALRKTREPADVLERMGEALGYPIEILSGAEEARLVYLGVSHDHAPVDGNRLVVDIGGGSTELILGQRFTPVLADSLQMGCVSFSMRYFDGGKITRKAFKAAEVAARLELEPLERAFRARGWEDCRGSSGTIGAIAELLSTNGWTDGTITPAGLKKLRRVMIELGSASKLGEIGTSQDRAPVLAGGVAILKAAFDSLGIESMSRSKAALREGALYDLLGRIRHEDVRDRTIRALSARYDVDDVQADNVERTARRLFAEVLDAWDLSPDEDEQLLTWAARVHEIGLAIAYPGHHKHGAYILANANLPGFSKQEQARLSALVRGHRRKLSDDIFAAFRGRERQRLFRLCILLRLAVRLRRTRSTRMLPPFRIDAEGNRLRFYVQSDWLEAHPLTHADLEDEGEVLRAADFQLEVVPEGLPQAPAEGTPTPLPGS